MSVNGRPPRGARTERPVTKKIRARAAAEHGQSLVIVALAMVAVLGMAALAIDVGTWYEKHHQAQVAADGAALAAANCMANAGSSGDQCTSSTDSTDATTVATTYAADNNVPITSSDVSVSLANKTVTVTTPNPAASFFARLSGILSTTPTAEATASWVPPTSGACVTPGSGCAAIFAMGTSCADGSSTAPIEFNGQNDTIDGSVHSNGSIYLQGGGGQALGPTTYGNGSGCTAADNNGGGGDTFTSGPTSEAPIPTWPDDYSQILTACGGTGEVACTGPGGTPSYCTQAAPSFDFTNPVADNVVTDNVYCAYGTGTPSNPATWTGLIYFQAGNLGSASTPIQGTWIGGTIEVGHKSYLQTQTTTPTYPVLYAVGSGTCSSASVGGVCMSAAGNEITGGIFAPNGTVQFNGGSTATDNFVEGQAVDFIGGSFTGSGPTNGGTTGTTPGSDSLTQ